MIVAPPVTTAPAVAASSSPAWLTPRATSVKISSTRAWTMRARVWRERTLGFRPPIEGTSTVSSSSTRLAWAQPNSLLQLLGGRRAAS